ncbi:uncharacterized protein E5676_scaffold208G001400 [Cucumis melo var. makuwa]|uniref:Uncharacterized protein n=1 Tax=Cucumis melo var. makuwa TaxID=1194695 RepID=A0A5D3E3J9_CUCMM|nr:uncharacterized protein E5676_scaffold208G001400 [Cucumis melo var. makuwa]
MREYSMLSRYVNVIMASESDTCRRFERGLRFEIRTPVTAIVDKISKSVETALLIEQSITEEKSIVEISYGASTASSFRGLWIVEAFQERLPTVDSNGSEGPGS